MKNIGLSKIRRWLLLFLAMVGFTAMVVFLLVTIEISNTIDNLTLQHSADISPAALASLKSNLGAFRLRLIMLFTGGILLMLIIGYAWMAIAARRIERPLRTIEKALAQLARGKLNETVVIDSPDEFGRMGAGVNEVAVNLQELLLYIWKQTGQCLTLIDRINNNPDFQQDRRLTLEGLGYLKQLSEAIDDLRDMAKAYVFYDVSLEGNRAQAITPPGETTAEDN